MQVWPVEDDIWEKLFIKAKQKNEVELFSCVLRLLWQNRNNVFHNYFCTAPLNIAGKAKQEAGSFMLATECTDYPKARLMNQVCQPPPASMMKLKY